MNKILTRGFIGALLLTLIGCGGNGSDSDDDQETSQVDTVFTADPDGEAVEIVDAADLANALDAQFGDENDDPVAVEPTDTIEDVRNRAGNG